MLILTSWLKEFVPFECSVPELAHELTMAGLEVEGIESAWKGIEKVKAVRILSCTPHPSEKHLRICSIDTGEGEVTVVCGAPNIKEGKIAALALPGTVLPDGNIVKEALIHDVRSRGMLCSEAELGIGEDASGLLYLNDDIKPGTPIIEALGLEDQVLELGITPNRPDCLSVLGVAREISALKDLPLTMPFKPAVSQPEKPSDAVSITIEDSELCGRYVGAIIRGVKVGPAPVWITSRLAASGIRPINNIVDVTNYVMLETGQPLHAFDLNLLDGKAIVIRCAKRGEKLTTLDGKERELQEDMLTICDASKPVAVAGVMGGANSEVSGSTVDILLESAWFQPSQVRRTARRLKLSTEASFRFERGVDPSGTLRAMHRAAELILQTAGGTLEAWRDECPKEFAPARVTLRTERAARLIGADIPADQMENYLSRLSFETTREDGLIKTVVPLFRPDIAEEIDLVEEIARMYGFDNIPTTTPVASIITEELESYRDIESRLRHILASYGVNEIISYSFTSPTDITALGFAQDDPRLKMVRIQNPLTEDQSVMRTSLVPSLLRTVSRNMARRNLDLRLFETGSVFIDQGHEKQPREEKRLACAITGKRLPESWAWPDEPCDFFDLKGILEELLESLGINYEVKPQAADSPFYLSGASISVLSGNTILGTAGQIAPQVLKKFDISAPLYLFDLGLDEVLASADFNRQFRKLPRYPSVELDIAIVVNDSIRAADIISFIKGHAPALLEDVRIFDVYSGKPIPQGKKSVAVRFTYRAKDHTLTDDEVNVLHQPLVDDILRQFQAELRQ